MQYVDQLDPIVAGVLLVYAIWALRKLAAGAPTGLFISKNARRAPAGRAAIVSLLATPLLIAQWIVAGGSQLPGPAKWIDHDGGVLVVLRVVNAAVLVVGLLYPGVWGCLVLWRRMRRHEPVGPKLILASFLATVTMLTTISVVRFESDLTLAHHFADPNAFHRLAKTCAIQEVLCHLVPARLWSPDRAGIPAWIAGDPTAPSDVIYALTRSGDPLVRRAAAANPRLPAEAFTDPLMVASFEAAFYMVTNPHIPAEALDSLITRYDGLRRNLIRDRDYMCNRAAPSTMRILGTDEDDHIRAAAAHSPRAPDDLLYALTTDPSPVVRKTAQDSFDEREQARQNPSAAEASCVLRIERAPTSWVLREP